MTPTVDATLERFAEHRQAFMDTEQGAPSRFLGRRGGPLEIGYPAPPKEESPEAEAALDPQENKAEKETGK
jgi:hypothetical protein